MAALDKETLVAGLGGLGLSPVFLKHAFLALTVQDEGIATIELLRKYPHLQVVNLSGNNITDVSPLAAAAHIKSVNLAGNKLTSVLDFQPEPMQDNFEDHEFRVCVGSSLDDADLSNNCIEVINDVSQHRFLRRLILANNQIRRMTGLGSLSHLQTLDLSNNRIERIEGIDNLPLKTLNLEGNQLTRIRNMHTLTQLQVLSVARNQIQSLTGLQKCKALNVLDASENQIDNIHEVHHLADLPLLSRLSLRGNAVTDALHYRLRVLVYTRSRLEFLDDEETSAEEKVKGANLFGADAEHRKMVHEKHIEEEPFVNYMPPFEDDESKKQDTIMAGAQEFADEVSAEYAAKLYDDVSAGASNQRQAAETLVGSIIGDTVDQLATGTIGVQRA